MVGLGTRLDRLGWTRLGLDEKNEVGPVIESVSGVGRIRSPASRDPRT